MNSDPDWDKPITKWVPHTIRCKCGVVAASGLQLHSGYGFVFPSSTIQFELCADCLAKQGYDNGSN